MSSTVISTKPILSGHEKFVFRYGWLKKGLDAAEADPNIFNNDQALVDLGVGKNMVRSIRHWCLATGMLTEVGSSGRGNDLVPTELAKRLFGDRGWDPYLEDPGTLWLLHWQLATNPARGLVWRAVFGHYYEAEFTKRQIALHVTRFMEKSGVSAKDSTIQQNVDVCLRTYVPAQRNKKDSISEDTFDSPLADLDLVRYLPEDGMYRFNIGPKDTLAPAIFAFALLNYIPEVIQARQTISVDDCIYQQGSPGQFFKLDENSVIDLLEMLEEMTDGMLRLNETTGIRQVYLSNLDAADLEGLSHRLLDQYYSRHAII